MTEIAAIKDRGKALKIAYHKHQGRKKLFIVILIPVVMVLIGGSIAIGSANISFVQVYTTVLNKIFPGIVQSINHVDIIIWRLRLPRIIMAVVAGIALGSSGAVMQVILRNPLADPYMLGIASSASFGASLALIFGIGFFSGQYMVIGNAFIFSLLSSGIILMLSVKKNASPETMLLTGLALLFFFQAMTTILQFFGVSEAVKAAIFWSVGDLGKITWDKISIVLPIVAVGIALLIWKSWDLNVVNAGDESAKSLGLNISSLRIFTMVVSSLMVASVVSFVGTIGFIGLVAPHLVRMLVGTDNRYLVPASGLVGGVLLTLSDTVARTILTPIILPVGSVTAFLGVPLFMYLIIRKGGKH